jgi:hypothetical protein
MTRQSRHARARTAAVALVGAAALVGCSPEPVDFRSDAENLLEDELTKDPGGTWTATCTEPTDAAVDTTFRCTVTDAEGVVRNFDAVITGRATYTVSETPLPSDSPASE